MTHNQLIIRSRGHACAPIRICWCHMLASQLTCLGVAGTFAMGGVG